MIIAIRKAYRFIKHFQEAKLYHRRKKEAQKRILMFQCPYKLHIGCGNTKLDGWVNIDLSERLDTVDIVWDATEGFPFKDESCVLIYNEHFLEHLTVKQASRFLTECYRLLKPGGILRIAMPSLEYVVQKYNSEDWRNQAWLTWPQYQFVQTRAEMLNISFRWWGHQWFYDHEELHRRIHEAGFVQVRDVEWGSSNVSELRNLETRADSLLICEAQR